MAETEQRVDRRWQSAAPQHEVIADTAKRLASVGGRVDVGRQTVTAAGGSAVVYRILGSNFPGVSRWMPWSASAHVVPDVATGGAHVKLAVISEQGFYAYQGGRTARKWQTRLEAIADVVHAAKQ